ncbi:putative transcription factor kapC [Colletotrichum orbiculare MAFF 240422]|uniref:Putative transcription factor kapC n=1 Tax=Colletotrichum orbiculare (strain 104-T / ATCC 96160 / CBS 514.97 / LARS 414 / MAFF 240422) TaxID=1213857 RepID=A0A484G9W6_COLOR|nr:putative transcription factor kapC [Colletotrichum orbiculare MAFF 240422]
MQSASPSPSTSATNTTNTDDHLAAQIELLSQHNTLNSSDNTAAPSRGARPQAAKPANASPAHGYSNGTTSPPSDVLPPIVNNHADPEAHIHPDLRARIPHAPAVNMMPAGVPPPPPPQQAAPPATIAGPSTAPPPPPPPPQHVPHPTSTPMALDDASAEGRKAKRELSSSKRAAQNRAAQRAFRQRKEGYIKKLELQNKEYEEMEQSYKAMQSENYALRDRPASRQRFRRPAPAPNPAAGTPLEAVAQAVAGLAAQEELAERQQFSNKGFQAEAVKEEPRRPDEDVDTQMQQPDGLPAAPTASM